MSCLRETLPHGSGPQVVATNSESKKRRFQPLRNLRRIFRRKLSPAREPEETVVEVEEQEEQRRLSLSHDCVFGGVKSQQVVNAELLDVVRRRRTKTTSEDEEEEEEDLGLPKSPCNSPIKENIVTKSQSTCSDNSLLSIMGSSDLDEDSRYSSKASLPERKQQSGDLPFATVPSNVLDHSAAKHKMAVRPRKKHAPRRRPPPQSCSALPHVLLEEQDHVEFITTNIYSTTSTVVTQSKQLEAKQKSSSLPPGFALTKLSTVMSSEETVSSSTAKSFFTRFLPKRISAKRKVKTGAAARQRVQPMDLDDDGDNGNVLTNLKKNNNEPQKHNKSQVNLKQYHNELESQNNESCSVINFRKHQEKQKYSMNLDGKNEENLERDKKENNLTGKIKKEEIEKDEVDIKKKIEKSQENKVGLIRINLENNDEMSKKSSQIYQQKHEGEGKICLKINTQENVFLTSQESENEEIDLLAKDMKSDIIIVDNSLNKSNEKLFFSNNDNDNHQTENETTVLSRRSLSENEINLLKTNKLSLLININQSENECIDKGNVENEDNYDSLMSNLTENSDVSLETKIHTIDTDVLSIDSVTTTQNSETFSKSSSTFHDSLTTSWRKFNNFSETEKLSEIPKNFRKSSDSLTNFKIKTEFEGITLNNTRKFSDSSTNLNNIKMKLLENEKIKNEDDNDKNLKKKKNDKVSDNIFKFKEKPEELSESFSIILTNNEISVVNNSKLAESTDEISQSQNCKRINNTATVVEETVQYVNTKKDNLQIHNIKQKTERIHENINIKQTTNDYCEIKDKSEDKTKIFNFSAFKEKSEENFSNKNIKQVLEMEENLKNSNSSKKLEINKRECQQVPEFLKIQLNKIENKTSNVILSTGSEKLLKRKFSCENVEIVEKEIGEEIVVEFSKQQKETELQKQSETAAHQNQKEDDRKTIQERHNAPQAISKTSIIYNLPLPPLQQQQSIVKSNNTQEQQCLPPHQQLSKTSKQSSLLKCTNSTSCEEVILRKKPTKSSSAEQPELLKVFARRSLKLKDSDTEILVLDEKQNIEDATQQSHHISGDNLQQNDEKELPMFKKIQQRKEEWEKRAKLNT